MVIGYHTTTKIKYVELFIFSASFLPILVHNSITVSQILKFFYETARDNEVL